MSQIDPETLAALDWLLSKKYPNHLGHTIQPLAVRDTMYRFSCTTCGSWSAPVTLVVTMQELYCRVGKVNGQ